MVFILLKYGESFSNIPTLGSGTGADGRLGVTVVVNYGSSSVQTMGTRWANGTGDTPIVKTVILSANDTIVLESILSRATVEQYREAPGSIILITYMPL